MVFFWWEGEKGIKENCFFWGVTVSILHMFYRILMVFVVFVLMGDIFWLILFDAIRYFSSRKNEPSSTRHRMEERNEPHMVS